MKIQKCKIKPLPKDLKQVDLFSSLNIPDLLDEQAESISGGAAIALPNFIRQSRY